MHSSNAEPHFMLNAKDEPLPTAICSNAKSGLCSRYANSTDSIPSNHDISHVSIMVSIPEIAIASIQSGFTKALPFFRSGLRSPPSARHGTAAAAASCTAARICRARLGLFGDLLVNPCGHIKPPAVSLVDS